MTRHGDATILRFAPIARCVGCHNRVPGKRLWCGDCAPAPAPLADLFRLLFRCADCDRPLAWRRQGLRHVLLDEHGAIVGPLPSGHRACADGAFPNRTYALERSP